MGLLSFNPLRGGFYAILAAVAAATFAREPRETTPTVASHLERPALEAPPPLPRARPSTARVRNGAGLSAPDRIAGPVAAFVERVVDGDTLAVRARVWVGEEVRVLVRLRGIDTPEMNGRCDGERAAARQAKAMLAGLVGTGEIGLTGVSGGKYFGRVVADVATADGRDAARILLAAGLARPYGGGGRAPWCAAARPGAVGESASR